MVEFKDGDGVSVSDHKGLLVLLDIWKKIILNYLFKFIWLKLLLMALMEFVLFLI